MPLDSDGNRIRARIATRPLIMAVTLEAQLGSGEFVVDVPQGKTAEGSKCGEELSAAIEHEAIGQASRHVRWFPTRGQRS